MTNQPLAYIATSRTGDNARFHEVFELALLEVRPGQADRLSVWRMRPTRMPDADADTLARYRYHEREHYAHPVVAIDPQLGTAAEVHPTNMAAGLATQLFRTHVVTLDNRDLAFAGRFLESHGQLVGWTRTLDMAAITAGALAGIRAGWYSAPSHPPQAPATPFDVLDEMPWQPYRLVQAIGAGDRLYSDADDAAARALLTRQAYAAVFGTARVQPMIPAAEPGPALDGDPHANGEHHPALARTGT